MPNTESTNTQAGAQVNPVVKRPMIAEEELAALMARYGTPALRAYNVQADEYIYSYRWRGDSDRRAEVVFAIQDERGRVWVHSKPHYPAHIFRIPSGGVAWNEPVDNALFREVDEETGLPIYNVRFLGLIEYRFIHEDSMVRFASYVFHLRSNGAQPVCHAGESICGFRAVLPSQVCQIAEDLRNLIGVRRGWGQWRALAHDLVYESLSS
jgi:ADP-ribose pyrophosphatase YjhB (NUDIX family)